MSIWSPFSIISYTTIFTFNSSKHPTKPSISDARTLAKLPDKFSTAETIKCQACGKYFIYLPLNIVTNYCHTQQHDRDNILPVWNLQHGMKLYVSNFILITRLPTHPDTIKFIQCFNGQKSASLHPHKKLHVHRKVINSPLKCRKVLHQHANFGFIRTIQSTVISK